MRKLIIKTIVEIGVSDCLKYCKQCEYLSADRVDRKIDSFWCNLFREYHGGPKKLQFKPEEYVERCDECIQAIREI